MVMKSNPLSNRQPMLMKSEFSGKAIVSLSPKMYICTDTLTDDMIMLAKDVLNGTNNLEFDPDDTSVEGKVKVSCKGCSKRSNHYSVQGFLNVLKTQSPMSAINHNFRFLKQNLYLQSQERRGPDYFYVKRYVLDCGVRTRHLNYDPI